MFTAEHCQPIARSETSREASRRTVMKMTIKRISPFKAHRSSRFPCHPVPCPRYSINSGLKSLASRTKVTSFPVFYGELKGPLNPFKSPAKRAFLPRILPILLCNLAPIASRSMEAPRGVGETKINVQNCNL